MKSIETGEAALIDELAALRARVAEADAERGQLLNRLTRDGYRRCDVAACNCGNWHAGPNLRAEKAEAERDAARELLELGQQESIAIDAGKDFVPRSELERVAREQREACAQSIRGKRMKRREDLALAVFFESEVRATPLVTEVRP